MLTSRRNSLQIPTCVSHSIGKLVGYREHAGGIILLRWNQIKFQHTDLIKLVSNAN